MSKVTTKERQKLSTLLKGKRLKVKYPPVKGTTIISAHVFNGRVVFDDHTHNDEYKLLLALLPVAGIKIDVQTESWCG